jgi:ureidoacrylate peracid hydrolase
LHAFISRATLRSLAAQAAEEATVPEHPLELGRCALVVNDLEQKMVQPDSPMYAPTAAAAVERLLPLLTFCREHGVPVAFAAIGPEATRWKAGFRIDVGAEQPLDLALSRLADRLGQAPTDFSFEKPPIGDLWPMSGVWPNTPLEAYLRGRGRDTVMLAGTTTQFGCDTAIREGANRGFRMVALRDCCATRPMTDGGWGSVTVEEIERVFFTTWAKAFARVMTAAEALAELQAQVH